MAKLSIFFLLCSLSMVLGNYFIYPNAPAVAGAMNYPYLSYGYAPSYALVAPQQDCDKKEKESSSSESSSSESSSSESSEESGEKKEEKESGEEKEEGGEEKEEGEEKKEGEEKEEGSSSSSSSSSEESKEGEEKKEEKKKEKKEEKSLFPPTTYSFPPVSQVVYAQSPYAYVQQPYKTYSVIQSAPVSYPIKSAYVAAPYAAPAIKGYPSQVTKIISAAPAARIVSVPAAKSYSGYPYLSPASGVLGLSSYVGNNLAYYKA